MADNLQAKREALLKELADTEAKIAQEEQEKSKERERWAEIEALSKELEEKICAFAKDFYGLDKDDTIATFLYSMLTAMWGI